MKKLLMLAIASAAIAMGSCNKDYKCYCHQQLNNKDTVLVNYQKERSIKNAKRSCENMSDSGGKCSLNQ
jgi:uncharacterized CHY-type Zn-finger protein